MCGSSLSGELFLVSLDVAGSLDQADMHKKQDHSANQKENKINQAYHKVDLNLDDS